MHDVYLIHARSDLGWVEANLAVPLVDSKVTPRLDHWEIIPGTAELRAMEEGLNNSKCCAVCVGSKPLNSLAGKLVQAAIRKNADTPEYRLIPVLLPGCTPSKLPAFLREFRPVDFRTAVNLRDNFELLVLAIKGVKPGPPSRPGSAEKTPNAELVERAEKKLDIVLKIIKAKKEEGDIDEKVAGKWLDKAFDDLMSQLDKSLSEGHMTVKER
jgi:hypothetical protein